MFNLFKKSNCNVIHQNNNLVDFLFTRLQSHVRVNPGVLTSYTPEDAQAFRNGEPIEDKEQELEIAMLYYWYSSTYPKKVAQLEDHKVMSRTNEYFELESELAKEKKHMLQRLLTFEEICA